MAETIKIRSPSNEELIRELPVHSSEDVQDAIRSSREIFPYWSGLSSKERNGYFKKVRKIFLEEKEKIVDTLHQETGKTKTDALIAEVFLSVGILKFYEENSEEFLKDQKVKGFGISASKDLYVRYFPYGLVGVITSWNYPLLLTFSDAFPALMAGNCVLAKPSSLTPLTALMLDDIFKRAGIPEGVYKTIVCKGRSNATDTFVKGVDMVAFTGSTNVGISVGKACIEDLKPCTLELGGKDPMIVLEDAKLERAANAAVFGSLMNTGQTCISIERIYVVDSVYSEFVSKVVEKTGSLTVGEDEGFNTDVGSMTSEGQLNEVMEQIDDAVRKGARILLGGKRIDRRGYFLEPTVIVDVNEGMDIMTEETFGPVIAIRRVKDADEAIELANSSIYGLNGAVFTNDIEKGLEIAGKIESGSLCINDCLINYGFAELPFRGVKKSGIGVRHSEAGIKRFCRSQSVVVDRIGSKKEIYWYPHSKNGADMMLRAIDQLYKVD